MAEARQQLAWLGPRRLAVVAGSPSDGATLVMADPVAGRVLSRQPASLLRRLAHWLVPPAEAKQVAGTWRSACWLGSGTLAVW